MGKSQIIANLFWIAFALGVCVESWNVKVGTFHKPGPGFFPFLAGGLLGVLSLIALVQSLGEKEETPGAREEVHIIKLGLLLAVLFLYAVLLNILGFLLGTVLLLLALFRMAAPYNWRTILLASALTIAATYFLFVVLLETQLPQGILGF